ncbi:paraquat-inducible protein A [Shewanella maritima]|uniref:Paraquat-inducible protein A n=1 Tax=Shewanella maritima TaxID=2520507 RepID=A0A411PIJ8_9GAMM|nr:paraquat-inducible protein A [Shewanella maritima]QBF83170.1 paraquat-inducible protein A [Shewanella maritima]
MRVVISIVLVVCSLALLIPGVTQPVLTITGSIEKAQMVDTGKQLLLDNVSANSQSSAASMLNMALSMLGLDEVEGQVEVFHKTRSIADTVSELYLSNHLLVAALVALFSIVIPAIKLLLMLVIHLPIKLSIRLGIYRFMALISKWSMADVFVVALIIVYMAGNASAGMGEMLQTQAQFENGFYFFAAYCLFAIASQVLLQRPSDKVNTGESQADETAR